MPIIIKITTIPIIEIANAKSSFFIKYHLQNLNKKLTQSILPSPDEFEQSKELQQYNLHQNQRCLLR